MHGPMSVLLPLRHLTGTTRARSALGGLILLCWGGLVIWLGMMVQREIDAFSTANSDNLQWTLAQADVEFLRFQLALEQAEADLHGSWGSGGASGFTKCSERPLGATW